MLFVHDNISDIISYQGGLYMSAVIAVCGINYTLIAGDSRVVSYENGQLSGVVSETYKKVHRINDSLCVGFTGDYRGACHMSQALSELDAGLLDMAQLAEALYTQASSFELGDLPLNILIAGKESNGVFAIIEMMSDEDFSPTIYAGYEGYHQVRCALPVNDDPIILEQIKQRVDRLATARTLDDMKSKVVNLIKNIASKNETVNKNIVVEIIT